MAKGKRGKGAYVTAEGLDGIHSAAALLRGEGLVESKRHHLEALRSWLDSWVLPGLDRVLRDAEREPPQGRKKAAESARRRVRAHGERARDARRVAGAVRTGDADHRRDALGDF